MSAERLRTEPRFPAVPEAAGHYESFYLRAVHPREPLGVWIRYTVHKRPGAAPRGSLWFTLFDGDSAQASKATLDAPAVGAGEGEYIHIGESRMTPGLAEGRAASEQLDASWRLSFRSDEEPLRHLPRDWMYERPLPRTKSLSPYPAATFDGELRIGDRSLEVEGWRGMVGHNWGSEHAERWIWLHGICFDGEPDVWIDMTVGRVRVGPFTTPWIANGALSVANRRHRLGGIERVRRTKVAETATGAELVLPGPDMTVRVSVGAPRERFVAWVYADPDGSEHNTANCSTAAMTIEVARPGWPDLVLRTDHGAAYELGMRETSHGLPLQPFADG